MAHVASRIEQYLDHRQIEYEVLPHQQASSLLQAARMLNIPHQHMLRAVAMQAND